MVGVCSGVHKGARPTLLKRRISCRSTPSPVSVAEGRTTSGFRLRELGSSALVVPEVCLGTMTWGKQNTEAEAHEQLSYAKDRGVNFLDTAEMYPVPTEAETQGRTDRYIGSWLKEQKREDIILATKVCGRSDRIDWVRNGGANPIVDRKNILESVEKSLERLQTDYIDLLQIHWPDRYVPLFGDGPYDAKNEREAVSYEEQLETLAELVRQGKVRALGVSNETSWGVSEFARVSRELNIPAVCSIQNAYSLLCRVNFETDLAEVCSKRNANVGLLAYSPLAGGALSGKYMSGNVPEGARFTLFPGYMDRYNKSLAVTAIAAYSEVASKYEMSLTELALRFVKSQWFTTSSIIGATTMQQLKENIDCFEKPDLDEEILEEIKEVYKKYRDPAMR